MNKSPQDFVIEFHETYCQPSNLNHRNAYPLLPVRRAMRLNLILEEVVELADATKLQLDPWIDSPFPSCGSREQGEPNLVEMADALGDIVYVCYGMAIEMGVDLDKVIEEIHRSNMSKLDESGKPIYREDGKVLKGPNYFKPDIKGVLGL